MGKQWKRGQGKNRRWFFLLVVLLVLMAYSLIFMDRIVKPTIASIGETKVSSMLTQTINDVVREKFIEDIQAINLMDIKTDEAGKVTMVQANSVAMTQLAYDLAGRIQDRIKSIPEGEVLIPVGTILGSEILSQTGPKVSIKVLPMGTTKVAFKTEFEEAGINQTKYKVYLEVETQAKVLIPFSSKVVFVNNTLLIAETIIVGDVPETYIFVPEDQMMDAWNNS